MDKKVEEIEQELAKMRTKALTTREILYIALTAAVLIFGAVVVVPACHQLTDGVPVQEGK